MSYNAAGSWVRFTHQVGILVKLYMRKNISSLWEFDVTLFLLRKWHLVQSIKNDGGRTGNWRKMYEYAIVLCGCFRIGYRRWKWAAKACFCIRNSRPKGIRWSYITTCPWRSMEKTTTTHRPQEEKYSNTLAYSYKQDTLSTTLYIGTLFLMLGSLVRFLPLGLSENLKGFRAFSRKCSRQKGLISHKSVEMTVVVTHFTSLGYITYWTSKSYIQRSFAELYPHVRKKGPK